MTMGDSRREPESWLLAITRTLGTFIAILGGMLGLGAIMIDIGAEPKPPGAPLIERPLVVGLGVLAALLAVAGLICAYGRGWRSTRVRLGGLLAVDTIFVIAVVLIRVFGP